MNFNNFIIIIFISTILFLFFHKKNYKLLNNNINSNINNNINNYMNTYNHTKNKDIEHFDSYNRFCDSKSLKKKPKLKQHLLNVVPININKSQYYPKNTIPFNFNHKLEYNILNNIENTDINTNKRLQNEKKIYGDIMPSNTNIIYKNFDKNIDSYVIDKIVKYKNKDCKQHIEQTKVNIKLYGRLIDEQLRLNWNIPVLKFNEKIIKLHLAETPNSCEFDEENAIPYIVPTSNDSFVKEDDTYSILMFKKKDRLNYNVIFKQQKKDISTFKIYLRCKLNCGDSLKEHLITSNEITL